MKVIFLQDMQGQGRRGQVKEVADGYGRNFLLPRKLALQATPATIKDTEAKLKQEAEREAEKQQAIAADMARLAQRLEGVTFTFKQKVASEDRLYGSIRKADVAQAVAELTGFSLDKDNVQLEEPIRSLGSYEIAIRLNQDLIPTVKIVVEEEQDDGGQREATTPQH